MTKQVKILYVDDERGNIDYFKAVFRREYEILTANSGEEGLAVLSEHPDVPVILTDQRMPRMSGVEFLRRSIDISRDSIRILVTGYADMETVINAVNHGHIYYYISKPWTYDEMQIVIKRAIETFYLRIINKELLIKSERVEKERAIAQLENLRNQVNPHFLFNCLNTLHAMFYENSEARDFVKKLASTYRYLLEHNDNLVVLQSEIDFVDNYVFLQKARFKDAFSFENLVKVEDRFYYIPSASLQLLVENTLKHNIVTREKPLKVEVFVEDNWLVVRNNYQPKDNKIESTGIGQENLKKRLSYLALKEPVFTIEGDFYIAKIPLLKDKP